MGAGARHAVWYVCLRPSWAGGDGDGEMCPRPTATARRPVYSRPRRGRTLAIAGTDRCAHLVDVLFALFASCNNRLGVSIPN
jgi:hypothetical protein